MKHKLIFSLIISSLILTGCIKFNTSVKINADGSSDVTLVYGMDKQLAFMDEQFSLEDSKSEAEAEGYKVVEYQDDRFIGYKLTRHFETLAELSKQIDADGMAIEVVEDPGFFKNKYTITGSFDLSGMTGDNSNEFDQRFAEAFIRQMDLKFSLSLPKEAGENNASKVKDDGKTLIWNLAASNENIIEVEYEKMNYVNISLLLGITIVVLAGVAIVVRKRRVR